MVQEEFITLPELQSFIDGLQDSDISKVFFRVEQRDGYNYLCVYLDNRSGDRTTDGFRKYYEKKMNKVH